MLAFSNQATKDKYIKRIANIIFKKLPPRTKKEFNTKFLKVIKKNINDKLVPQFIYFLLADKDHGVLQYSTDKYTKSIQTVIDLYQDQLNGESVSIIQWQNAAANAGKDADVAHADNAVASYAASYAAYAAASVAVYSDIPTILMYIFDVTSTSIYAAYAANFPGTSDDINTAYSFYNTPDNTTNNNIADNIADVAKEIQAKKFIELIESTN